MTPPNQPPNQPPDKQDGAQAVIHAASCNWEADAPKGKKVAPADDLRCVRFGLRFGLRVRQR
jgi:hypothetical protein